MDGLYGKTLLKWMIWGAHPYFWKHLNGQYNPWQILRSMRRLSLCVLLHAMCYHAGFTGLDAGFGRQDVPSQETKALKFKIEPEYVPNGKDDTFWKSTCSGCTAVRKVLQKLDYTSLRMAPYPTSPVDGGWYQKFCWNPKNDWAIQDGER